MPTPLSPEQREAPVTLLHALNTAVMLAPRTQQHYLNDDSGALGYLIVTWGPVSVTYFDLALTIRRSGEEHAA